MKTKLSCYLKIFASLLKTRVLGRNVPFMLEYQINKACNLSCKYCYADLDTQNAIKEPSLEEIKSNIDSFYNLGTRVVRILGGEPVIRKDIGEIIRYIKQKGIFIELSTNATLLEGKVDDLKELDILQISIDGSKKSTDSVRGEGTYDKIIHGIEYALKNKLPVRLHGVYNRFSIDADEESPVAHLAMLSKKYNVPFNFCPFVADFSGNKMDAYVPLSELMKYHHECKKYKDAGYKYFNSNITLKQMLEWPDLSKDVFLAEEKCNLPNYFCRCKGGESYCFLDMDGSLYPCVPLWKRGLNIYEVGIEEAWDYIQKVRQDANCFTCASIGDIEFSRTLSLDRKVLLNTLRKVLSLRKK